MKKEHFIEKARAIHGDKFDYSLLPDEFKSRDKVPLLCKNHGVWYVTMGNHITNKRGCPTCGFEYVSGIKKQRAKDSFVEKSKKVHGDLYDYSLADYVKSGVKVKIICSKHGVFEQCPTSHMSGCGCPACGIELRSLAQRDSNETFIAKAEKVHGNIYDYSKLVYVSQKVKVEIVCKEHGSFWQKTNNHLNGNGCPLCLPAKLSQIHRLDYDKVKQDVLFSLQDTDSKLIEFNYENSNSFCKLNCKKHGEYKQRIRAILSGHGCAKCASEVSAKIRSNPVESYIPEFQRLYNGKYDYSLATGDTSKSRFKVICPEHGEFTTTVTNHLCGKGCVRCSDGDRGYSCKKSGVFYILKITDNVIKFGISNNFDKRLKDIIKGSCFDISCMYKFNFEDGQIPREIESEVIASDIVRSVVSRCDMVSGYTETTYLYNLTKILSIVSKYESV